AAPGAEQLCFAEHRMSESKEMSELVCRDGLHVVPAGLAAWRHGPDETRVQEDVGLEDLAGDRVDVERRRAQRAIQIGPGPEADHRGVVDVEGGGRGEPAERGRQLYVVEARPAAERAR